MEVLRFEEVKVSTCHAYCAPSIARLSSEHRKVRVNGSFLPTFEFAHTLRVPVMSTHICFSKFETTSPLSVSSSVTSLIVQPQQSTMDFDSARRLRTSSSRNFSRPFPSPLSTGALNTPTRLSKKREFLAQLPLSASHGNALRSSSSQGCLATNRQIDFDDAFQHHRPPTKFSHSKLVTWRTKDRDDTPHYPPAFCSHSDTRYEQQAQDPPHCFHSLTKPQCGSGPRDHLIDTVPQIEPLADPRATPEGPQYGFVLA